MPRVNLVWYQPIVRRIMRDVKALKQKDIAEELNESQQTISYRMNNVYEKELTEWVQILDKAGYEIREKEYE